MDQIFPERERQIYFSDGCGKSNKSNILTLSNMVDFQEASTKISTISKTFVIMRRILEWAQCIISLLLVNMNSIIIFT